MENMIEIAMEAIMSNREFAKKTPSVILAHLAEQATEALCKAHLKMEKDYTQVVESMPNGGSDKIDRLKDAIRHHLIIGRKYQMQDFYMQLGDFANGIGRNYVYALVRQVGSSLEDSVFIETADMFGKYFIICQNRLMDSLYKQYKGFVRHTTTSFAEFIMTKKAYDIMHSGPEFILEDLLTAFNFHEPIEIWRFKKWVEYYFIAVGGTVSFLNTEKGTQASGRHPNFKYFQ